MKAVAYYRTRPSEPAASESALKPRREAVHKAVEEGCTWVAEFSRGDLGSRATS
jgi:hypothetical protein